MILLGERVIVKKPAKEEKTSGIILQTEEPQYITAEVIAIGATAPALMKGAKKVYVHESQLDPIIWEGEEHLVIDSKMVLGYE